MPRRTRCSLYGNGGVPCPSFNRRLIDWLSSACQLVEHQTPKAFESTRVAYDAMYSRFLASGASTVEAHKAILCDLTKLMSGIDINSELESRLSSGLVNPGGIRTTVAQGVVKNTGENFVNTVVYALAKLLSGQDEVLVDKGAPPVLKESLRIMRSFRGRSEQRKMTLDIEADLTVFARGDPLNAIIVSAKTRLKEVFHVGTMWKLLFDMIGDPVCQAKWGLSATGDTSRMVYAFATSDSIRSTGRNSQGPDLKPEGVRNLIAADASFFDYVFVSKTGLDYVSTELNLTGGREALFHELGCLVDLISQKFREQLIL